MKKYNHRAGLLAAVALAMGLAYTPTALADDTADYTDAIKVAWEADGPFEPQTSVTIFPDPRVVPGDSDAQELFVRHDGPTPGVLVATMTNLTLAGDPADDFYRDFTINSVPVIDLYGDDIVLLTQELQPGAVVSLDFDYDFPFEATSGNYPEEGQVAVSFDVELQVSGELPDDPEPTPGPKDPEPKDPTPPPSTPPGGSPGGKMPVTGFDSGIWFFAAIAALIGGGVALRRRRSPGM